MNLAKFFSLYWYVVAIGGTASIAAVWGSAKAWITRKRNAADNERKALVASAAYWEPTAEENIIQLNRAANVIQTVVEALDDPTIGSMLEIQTRAVGGKDVKAECQEFLDQLARRGVQPRGKQQEEIEIKPIRKRSTS